MSKKQSKKHVSNISTGVLAIFGIVGAIAAVCAIIVFLPVIITAVFFLTKWLVIIALFVGVIWLLGLSVNKLISVKKAKSNT